MALSTQALKYGWVALASLGVLTGTTIYVLNNTRKTVRAEDVIQIALGVTERCLATQYATNPVAYRVPPPSFTNTWYSNAYTTSGGGVAIFTNVITNCIGWHPDRSMLIKLDETISNLVPWFIDETTISDGTTEVKYYSVTSLWATLGIGDRTNKFTQIPAIGANPAVYGGWGRHIYETNLVERYKVLQALKYTRPDGAVSGGSFWYGHGGATNWSWPSPPLTDGPDDAKYRCANDHHYVSSGGPYHPYAVAQMGWNSNGSPPYIRWWVDTRRRGNAVYSVINLNTSIVSRCYYFIWWGPPAFAWAGGMWDDQKLGLHNSEYDNVSMRYGPTAWGSATFSPLGGDPSTVPTLGPFPDEPNTVDILRGFAVWASMPIAEWAFLYCTDKFW